MIVAKLHGFEIQDGHHRKKKKLIIGPYGNKFVKIFFSETNLIAFQLQKLKSIRILYKEHSSHVFLG
jgi:hypothetical protein